MSGGGLLVTYFFQGEPGESLEVPNAFMMPTCSSVTFGQFLSHFPPSANGQGEALHFRFRKADKACGYCWLDVVSPLEQLPVENGGLVVKILRPDPTRSSRLRRKKIADFGVEGLQAVSSLMSEQESNPLRAAAATSSSSSGNNKSNGRGSSNSSGSSSSSSSSSGGSGGRGGGRGGGSGNEALEEEPDLLSSGKSKRSGGSGLTPPPSHHTEAAPDLVDFGSPSPSSSSSGGGGGGGGGGASFLPGMDGLDVDTVPSPPKMTREELAARREASIQENVKQALEFKQELDENSKRESEEIEAAKQKHDKGLTEWAFDQSKKKRNVRTLLTTMHRVLWPENTWKPVGLGDVIEPKKVKLVYRKAMLVVHPDRCSAGTAESRFIAKRVFEAINEAYQEFLKSESVE